MFSASACVPAYETVARFPQLLNAPCSTRSSVPGSAIDARFQQYENAPDLIDATPSGIAIEVSAPHS